MVKSLTLAGALGAFITGAFAQTAGPWGQCGGFGWNGPTTCPAGWHCAAIAAPWYYQCLQGSGSSTPTPTSTSTSPSTSSTSSSSFSITSVTTSSSTFSTRTSSSPTSTTSQAPNPSNTLIPGNAFIRGVEGTYFHHYLQSEVVGTASDAVLGSPSTAAQFQIVNGQLIQNPQGDMLYAVVAQPQSGDVKLKVTWSTNPDDTFGTFAWTGDTLEWSDASVQRPQNNAWLICPDSNGNEDVYINLGPYSYNTPAGCGDQTIHAYTGPTAVV